MMRTSAETSSKTVSRSAHQTAAPFFGKAHGSGFFQPAAHAGVPAIQMKMSVSQPGDKLEQEADRIADQVVRDAVPPASAQDRRLQRPRDDKLQKKDDERIQKAPAAEERIQRANDERRPNVQAPQERLQR